MREVERLAGDWDAIRALLAQARDQTLTHPASARYYLDAALKRLDQIAVEPVDEAEDSLPPEPLAALPAESPEITDHRR